MPFSFRLKLQQLCSRLSQNAGKEFQVLGRLSVQWQSRYLFGPSYSLSKLFTVVVLLLSVGGCVSGSPPNLQYALAKEALDAARMTDAARFSSGFFYKAEGSYRDAVLRYEEKEYDEAKALFLEAIQLAEKAENSTRLIRHQTGEIL